MQGFKNGENVNWEAGVIWSLFYTPVQNDPAGFCVGGISMTDPNVQ